MALETGSIVEGTITGIANFGAFVRLPDGSTGLVHISEIADEYVTDVRNFVEENQTVQVKVLGKNEKGKYDLSIKQARESDHEAPPPKPSKKRTDPPRPRGGSGGDFEDLVSRWKKESEERLLDVKRNTDTKRGGRGGGKGGRK